MHRFTAKSCSLIGFALLLGLFVGQSNLPAQLTTYTDVADSKCSKASTCNGGLFDWSTNTPYWTGPDGEDSIAAGSCQMFSNRPTDPEYQICCVLANSTCSALGLQGKCGGTFIPPGETDRVDCWYYFYNCSGVTQPPPQQ
jgi:hypothetical protein